MKPKTTEKQIAKPEKMKHLDQLLEDMAGDEFDEYGESDTYVKSSAKHFYAVEEFSTADVFNN